MFGFLYEMMAGQHDELSRRRRADTLTFDRGEQTFIAEERNLEENRWLGRGEVPGAALADATGAAGQTVAEETRRLLQDRGPGGRGDGAGGVEVAGPAVNPEDGVFAHDDLVARQHRVQHNRGR